MALIEPVKPKSGLPLRSLDPGNTSGVSHHDARARTAAVEERLGLLQETLYAAGEDSVLIVLQGLDTAGKDGTISHVMGAFDPAGCQVQSFKAPTPDELAHDFLWRVHRVTPARGTITIFNRSYYEDVLVARVHKLVPKEVWERRYDHINHFESLLIDNGTRVLKFCLYISKDEQRQRLLAREDDPLKAWKLSTSDWSEHARYDEYLDAYDDMLQRCSTPAAPWYVIPADHKWFRNLAVAQTIADVLDADQSRWEAAVKERGRLALAASLAARRDSGATTKG